MSIASLERSANRPRGLEHRSFPARRARGSGRYWLRERDFSEGARAALVDISQAGVSVLIEQSVESGEVLVLELESPSGHRLCRAVRVLCTSDEAEGALWLGCQWEKGLSFAELQKFI